jgi:hypothetical protein
MSITDAEWMTEVSSSDDESSSSSSSEEESDSEEEDFGGGWDSDGYRNSSSESMSYSE